ncbi:MAG: hypothetical protein ACR2QK_11270 [Acidimicrobiales bacterium]
MWISRALAAWGDSPPNHFADRAGRHRRVAIGFALLTAPMVMMASALLIQGRFVIFALAHLASAGSFLWVAWDLTRHASLIGRRNLPHVSVLALFLAFAGLRLSCPEGFVRDFGARPFFVPGLVMLGAALVILAVDDGRTAKTPQLTGLIGRVVLILGGVVLGLAEIAAMVNGLPALPVYSLGLGVVGSLLLATAASEARLLLLAVSLARLEDGALHR